MAPDAALEAAIELHGLLTPDMDRLDTTRAREVEVVRATWRKLRTRLACPPVDVTP